jgi:outer membrane protein OmpA-like peptidoglycan-associated protein
MKIKAIVASMGMLALLGACDTMSEYGNKMSESMSELGSSVKSAFVSDDGEGTKYVVYFKSNSTELTPGSEGTMTDAMSSIKDGKVGKARVIAYTDNRGSPKYNQQLSMRRAESIKQKLSSAGLSSVDVSGAGEMQGDSTAKGDSARRAEIYLIK